MKISNGIATMSQAEFDDLKERNMIVYSSNTPMFLYHGYANKIKIVDIDS